MNVTFDKHSSSMISWAIFSSVEIRCLRRIILEASRQVMMLEAS